jgi:hypothetical protein
MDFLYVFAMGCCAGWAAFAVKLILEDARRERAQRDMKWISVSVTPAPQDTSSPSA